MIDEYRITVFWRDFVLIRLTVSNIWFGKCYSVLNIVGCYYFISMVELILAEFSNEGFKAWFVLPMRFIRCKDNERSVGWTGSALNVFE